MDSARFQILESLIDRCHERLALGAVIRRARLFDYSTLIHVESFLTNLHRKCGVNELVIRGPSRWGDGVGA